MARVVDDQGLLGRASKPLGLRVYESDSTPDATRYVNAMIAIIDEDGDGRTARLAMSNGTTWDTIQFTREGEYAFDWTFDTGTSDADPGTGEVRANHATLSSATQLFISETDRLGLSQASAIGEWDDSTSSVKGYLTLIDIADANVKVRFRITGSITDAGTYRKIPVAYVSGVTSMITTNIAIEFERTGDSGEIQATSVAAIRYATKADFVAASVGVSIQYVMVDRVLSTSPLVPLTYKRGTGNPSGTYGEVLVSGVYWTPLYSTDIVNVAQFGAVGDNSTDDTTALQAAATYASSLYSIVNSGLDSPNPTLYFPACTGYRVTDTIEIKSGVSVNMRAHLVVVSPAATPIIGLHLTNPSVVDYDAPRHAEHRLMVRRATQSDWSSDNDIGVKVDAHYVGRLDFRYISGFSVGAEFCAAYGNHTFGEIRGCGKGLKITSRVSPDQFANQFRITGGSFARDGANVGTTCVGIYLDGSVGTGINSAVFDGQSYELSADGLPVHAVDNVLDVHMTNQRWEYNDGPFLKIDGYGRQIHCEVFYADATYAVPEASLLEDNGNYQTSSVIRMDGPSAPVWKHLVHDTGPLRDRILGGAGGVITVVDMEAIVNAGAAGGGLTQPIVYGDSGPSIDADGYMVNPGPFYGVQVELNGCRSLGITGSKKPSADMNVRLLCFDSAGAQLTSGTNVVDEFGGSGITYTSGAYRGYYTAGVVPGTDTSNYFTITLGFTSDVAKVFIALSDETKGWKIFARDPRPKRVTTSHNTPGQFFTNGSPSALTNVTYPRGMVAWRVDAISGGTAFWMNTNTGWKAGPSLA